MTSGIDQLHMKMTCKKYRSKLYITKPHDIVDHIIRNKIKGIINNDDPQYSITLGYLDNTITINRMYKVLSNM